MGGDARLRRRGRDIGLRGLLVEREAEVNVIERALAAGHEGAGGVVLVRAPAGKGKSRLLTIAGDLAREADMQVLGAHGSELEIDFPFGVAMQLFEPRWAPADEEERAQLLEGPARRAGGLLRGEFPASVGSPEEQAYAVIHGLFWMCANMVLEAGAEEPAPLVVLVDDVHWADRPSLRFLAYLAERIGELPIVLVACERTGEEPADRMALAALRRAARGRILRPDSLTADGVATLVHSVFPDADPDFCRACATVTTGNPFLVTELLEQLRRDRVAPDAAMAAQLADRPPESVMTAVVARMEALAPTVRQVARAVAVLGPGASPEVVSRLVELDHEATGRAADWLSELHLFHPGAPLGFVHPLIASAVLNAISPLDRSRLHRRAATILLEGGAPAEQIAVHLLAASPGSDPAALEALRTAARRALASGAAHSAARMLRRALAENAPPELQPHLLAELAEAESAAGLPHALARLEQAITVVQDAGLRARLAMTQARALYEDSRYREAAQTLSNALGELDEHSDLAWQLEAAYIAAAFFVPELTADTGARAARLARAIGEPPTGAQLDLLAHLAVHGGLRGEPRAAVVAMARAAWRDSALMGSESLDGLSWPLVSSALLYVDELELSLGITDAALARAREQASPASFAVASFCRAWPLYEQGRIAEAMVDAQAGLDASPDGWRRYERAAYAAIALCHLRRGTLAQAETALSIIEHPEVGERIHVPSLLEARAQLRLAQHRPLEALEDAMEAGRRLERGLGVGTSCAVAWRSTAALARLAHGDGDGAQALAAAELDDALRIEIPRLVIRNIRILGLAERGSARLDLLREAVARGERGPPRLDYVEALLDYGAELRRSNQRSASRDPLRRALDLAHRGGAIALAERARTELAATGARPRRAVLSGLESLTPSERRVAELAAQGLTTRQIAEALFVTPKTVEFHLRHTYRKLDINTRHQLAALLAEGPEAPPPRR